MDANSTSDPRHGTVAAARGRSGVLIIRFAGACRHCRIVQLVVAFELLPWCLCCSLLITYRVGSCNGLGQKRRAALGGRTASLELDMAAHYDIPTTLMNGASL